MSRVGWWARWTLGLRTQALEMLLLILWMVSGWRSLLGSRVNITSTGRESAGGFLYDSSEGLRHSLLLRPQLFGTGVDDDVAGSTKTLV